MTLELPPWLSIAEKELGVHEKPGADHEARIVEYHSATALKATDDETPWCSSFLNWAMKKANLDGTYSAAARSWLSWGVSLKVPAFGCVVVISRGSNPWQAHVGLYVGKAGPDLIQVLGGNQGNKVSIQTYPKWRVLPGGYRWA